MNLNVTVGWDWIGWGGMGWEGLIGMCPKGDDPLTTYTDFRSIIIRVGTQSAGITGGTFKFTFHDESISIPGTGWTEEQCKATFESLPNVDTVRCSVEFSISQHGGFTTVVAFEKFPVNPHQNNIYNHDGDPPLSAFACDTSQVLTVGRVTCTIDDVVTGILPGNLTGHFPLLVISFSTEAHFLAGLET